jgi:putative transposase
MAKNMLVTEFKLYGMQDQFKRIDECIRTTQFIRNKCIRLWINEGAKPKDKRAKIGKYEFSAQAAVLAEQYDFAAKLNSTGRQAATERAWASVARFYDNCKKKTKGKKGYPKFKHNVRSFELKRSGWKILENHRIIFGNGVSPKSYDIGILKLKGGRPLTQEHIDNINRVRVVKRATGYFVQFIINVPNTEYIAPTGKTIGLDVGLESFYVDSNAEVVENPRHLSKSEKRLKLLQRRVSRKKKRSANRRKAIARLGRKHFKVSCQLKDFAVKTARCVVKSNDFVAIEDLKVKNMLKNHCLAKAISDVSWGMFKRYLEYFGSKFGRTIVKVNPSNTSQRCSNCGKLPTKKKTLDVRVHDCEFCKFSTCRDHNAAINILQLGLSTTGHVGIHAWGDSTSTGLNESLNQQVESTNQEPLVPIGAGISRL